MPGDQERQWVSTKEKGHLVVESPTTQELRDYYVKEEREAIVPAVKELSSVLGNLGDEVRNRMVQAKKTQSTAIKTACS